MPILANMLKQCAQIGYEGNIVSFEPLPDAFIELLKNSKNDKKWNVNNYAMGNNNGRIKFNVASNSVSSSVLKMLPRHEESAPNSKYVYKVEVEN